MASTIEAVTDAENARVILTARNGVPGDSLIIIRRDQQGTNLVRQTSGDALPFLPDPAGEKINLVKDPANKTLNGTREIWRNQFLNPAAVTANAFTERRRNLCLNPSFEVDMSQWWPDEPANQLIPVTADISGVGVTLNGSASAKCTVKVGGTNDSYFGSYPVNAVYPGLVAGQAYTLSADLTLTAPQTGTPHPTRARSIQVFMYVGATLTPVVGAMAPNVAGTYRQSVTFTVPAGCTQLFWRLYNGGSPGDTVWWDSVLLEKTNIVLPYFDGDTNNTAGAGTDAGQMTSNWTGSAGVSVSTLNAQSISQFVGVGAEAYSASYGGYSGVFLPPNSTSNVSYADVDGGTGGLRSGMAASKTYTVSALCHVPAVQAGAPLVDARKIVVVYKIGAGADVFLKSTAAPNTVGSNRVTYTFSLPAGVTSAYVRLYNGSVAGAGVIGWSQFVLMEGSYAPDFFTGAKAAQDGVTYAWVGTANNSASTATVTKVKQGYDWVPAVEVAFQRVLNGDEKLSVMRIFPTGANLASLEGSQLAFRNGMAAGKTYTFSADLTLTAPLTEVGWDAANALRLEAVAQVSGAQVLLGKSSAAPNAIGTTRLSLTFTVPAGATGAAVRMWNGSAVVGEQVLFDNFTLVEGSWNTYFDGTTFNGAWTGTPNDSMSTLQTSSLPITVYDYEAKQGMETTYILATDVGVPGAFVTITTPIWGTWIKDPFRPFMNAKVLWNSDSEYERKARRVLLQAKGAELPVAHYDRRTAPAGTVTLATENDEQTAKLIALIKVANVVMIDVNPAFGVPVRYVSLGSFKGRRVGDEDRDLKWQARYWDLEVDEVASPIGVPLGQTLSYDQLAAKFGSYVSIPAIVDTYDDLGVGNWE